MKIVRTNFVQCTLEELLQSEGADGLALANTLGTPNSSNVLYTPYPYFYKIRRGLDRFEVQGAWVAHTHIELFLRISRLHPRQQALLHGKLAQLAVDQDVQRIEVEMQWGPSKTRTMKVFYHMVEKGLSLSLV